MQNVLQLMSSLGYRFTGTGGGRLYFAKMSNAGLDHKEFKSWEDVMEFARNRKEGEVSP